MSFDERFDVIVIGAGHAGCEAASAAARLGAETGLITLNLDLVGQMSCNPAIGGIAKGHLVREIDALGGIMGRVIDRTGIQFRLLNRSRGPAVQSPRAQADRMRYRAEMRRTLEATSNLHLRQGKVVDFVIHQGRLAGVVLEDGRRFGADAVVVATGTFLNGLIHTGRRTYSGGRAGEPASIELSETLKRLGFPVGRLKTGTPPRLDGRTIDWSAFEPQPGDRVPVPFSFSTDSLEQKQIQCYIGYTTNQVHDAIRENIAESPLYSGKIRGVGPRYCPSIEDKVVKFSEKSRHQLFLEPEGHDTNEVYLNGFSTSLPAELQQDLVRMRARLRSRQSARCTAAAVNSNVPDHPPSAFPSGACKRRATLIFTLPVPNALRKRSLFSFWRKSSPCRTLYVCALWFRFGVRVCRERNLWSSSAFRSPPTSRTLYELFRRQLTGQRKSRAL
jgi:tRNA uridine 5-carboxymethylaminomethyl modification enzyme